MSTGTREPFAAIWTREFLRDLRGKRARAQGSFDLLRNNETEYYRAHAHMLRLYDIAINAVEQYDRVVRNDGEVISAPVPPTQ